ncbi:MAG: HAD family hydrolase [Candidatus Methanofastidiosia archaeon]
MGYVIFFDMDGVLTPAAQALQIAEIIGKKEQVLKMFSGQLKKNVGLEWILSKGATFLAGENEAMLKEAAQKMPLTKSARRVVSELKKASYNPIIVTNGFEEVARVFGRRIGISEVYGNAPEAKDGIFTGRMKDTKLLTLKSKGDFVRKYLKEKNIAKQDSVAVGNDENDMFMFKEVGLSVVFNPSKSIKSTIAESVSKAIDGKKGDFINFTNIVDIVILDPDLAKILPFLVPKPDKFSDKVKFEETTVFR